MSSSVNSVHSRQRSALRLLVLLITVNCALFTLGSCGFSPLYGPSGGRNTDSVSDKFDTVTIGSIPDESGQYLRNALIDRLYRYGRPSESDYVLNLTPISEYKSDLDITKTATSTRTQIRLNTSMTLTDARTNKTLLSRKLVAINSFNVLQSQYDTRVSEQYVRQNALDDLARQVEAQLALYFRRDGNAEAPVVTQTP
jgi:LPS-assembly lipoprotein